MRIGFGYDVHKFVKRRKFVLGGVEIKYSKGLAGHSDADVLSHSICDALLGAAGLRDIGHYFPNTDKRYRNISSLVLLKECAKLIAKKRLKIVNIDSTVILEEPQLQKYHKAMKANIAKALGVSKAQVSIKATTSEGLGFVGTKKGCAAYSVCSLK